MKRVVVGLVGLMGLTLAAAVQAVCYDLRDAKGELLSSTPIPPFSLAWPVEEPDAKAAKARGERIVIRQGACYAVAQGQTEDPEKIAARRAEREARDREALERSQQSAAMDAHNRAVLASVQPANPAPKPAATPYVVMEPESQTLDVTPGQVETFVMLVRMNNFRCDSVSTARPCLYGCNFRLTCNRSRYTYEISDKGGHWIVAVQ